MVRRLQSLTRGCISAPRRRFFLRGARPGRWLRSVLGQIAAVAAGLVLLNGCSTPGEPRPDLPPADATLPAPDGLSWFSRAGLDLFLDFNAWRGADSGYVAMFARDGRVVHATVVGHADIEAGEPMRIDTRFRIASMTKPVTAVAAMVLIEAGRLGLHDPVELYVPAAGRLRVARGVDRGEDGSFATEELSRPLTVADLLTFTSGIGARDDASDLGREWARRDIYAGEGSLEQRVDRILSAPLYEQPGHSWRYGWSADVLARVVEVAAGEPFDRVLEERIFLPLGMDDTSFLPAEDERAGLATMYTKAESGELVRLETPASDASDWTPGGSGLVSTAGDYMRFALMLWNGGEYDGTRILSRESVALMTHPHVRSGVLADEGIEGQGWGLGLSVVVDAAATPTSDRDGDFWWAGYYGTNFFVSPETGLVGVVMSQNQPGPFSGLPYAIYLAPAFAFWGL